MKNIIIQQVLLRGDAPALVKAEIIPLEGWPEIRASIAHSVFRSSGELKTGKDWTVWHFATGRRLGGAETRKGAIADALFTLNNFASRRGRDCLLRAIELETPKPVAP